MVRAPRVGLANTSPPCPAQPGYHATGRKGTGGPGHRSAEPGTSRTGQPERPTLARAGGATGARRGVLAHHGQGRAGAAPVSEHSPPAKKGKGVSAHDCTVPGGSTGQPPPGTPAPMQPPAQRAAKRTRISGLWVVLVLFAVVLVDISYFGAHGYTCRSGSRCSWPPCWESCSS